MPTFANDLERLIAKSQADNDAIDRAKATLSQFLTGMQELSKLIDHADEWRLALYQRIAATIPDMPPPQAGYYASNAPRLEPADEERLNRLAASLTQPRG